MARGYDQRCDNCGVGLLAYDCAKDGHGPGCGVWRHYFATLPVSVGHKRAGEPAYTCGECAAAIRAGDSRALRALGQRHGRRQFQFD
jgi:hypothetical protein